MAEVVLALGHIEPLGGIFKRCAFGGLGVFRLFPLPGGEKKTRGNAFVSLARTNETVIGTRPAHFRYRLWKEACHAAEFL
ncbi:hypothetical protein G6L26_006230 [Agrobacterium radiobacter]|jgi:hypothetical protein|uniref:hypothetical protein n=1 Tax=Agrobacterium tumefaciens complex TaxID=1183400 RepID=UPI00076DA5ED|nr:hypothetical protein [Agrobacterium tumefaciens]KWT81470.1 hypothetical protein ASB65_15155 [Agrobacterium tumefaciens str. B6]MQB27204.1 hypothetical protein [Agrobacterium tumefaciens]NSZ32298.1 hypothetical protein [Agrobacterium tumefaciens]NTA04799.1 hypothetical protein [Agrobacterium tumefaciens]NTA91392.1 hypothetical protein [Agrobacterium tumefaciens]